MEFVTIEEVLHFLAAVGSFKGAIKTVYLFSSPEGNCYTNVVAGTVYQFDSSNFSINRYEHRRNPVERQKQYVTIDTLRLRCIQ